MTKDENDKFISSSNLNYLKIKVFTSSKTLNITNKDNYTPYNARKIFEEDNCRYDSHPHSIIIWKIQLIHKIKMIKYNSLAFWYLKQQTKKKWDKGIK